MRKRVMVKLYDTEIMVSNEASKAFGIPEADLIRRVYLTFLNESMKQGFEALDKQVEGEANADTTEA